MEHTKFNHTYALTSGSDVHTTTVSAVDPEYEKWKLELSRAQTEEVDF